MPMLTRFIGTLVAFACMLATGWTWPADAARSRGTAVVIDGNTLEIDGRAFRIAGLEAPEANQRCDLPDGTKWFCGRSAALVLHQIISDGTATCDAPGGDTATCRSGETDIGAEMIRRGMAWAAGDAGEHYRTLEAQAAKAGIGVFQARTERPSQLRDRRTREARNEAPGNCIIKGNVDGLGRRIYHLPWSQWYELTKVTPSRGERWFCSEGEAKAAGWRRAAWDFVPRLDPDDMPKGGVLENQR